MKNIAFAMILAATALSPLAYAEKTINLGEYSNVETGYRGDADETIKKIRLVMMGGTERIQVVLVPFKDGANQSGIDGGKLATSAMKGVLQDGGNMEIIDRNIPQQLVDELVALEMGGKSQGQSFNMAEFAIRGEVLEMAQSFNWTGPQTVSNDGKNYTTPATCTLTGTARVNVRVYNMNPLELMESFVVEGNRKSNYENVGSCQGISDNGQAMSGAVTDAIRDKQAVIKNMFPPSGLISGHMEKKNKHIFRTTLKPSDVRSEGEVLKMLVYKKVTSKDQITGQERSLISQIAKGKAVIAGDTGEVWVQVSKKDADQILLGDTVSVNAGCDGPLDIACQTKKLTQKIIK